VTSLAQAAARRLVAARGGAARPSWREIAPADRPGAYAIQDATIAQLGGLVAGWKVGARGPGEEPHCAPLPMRRPGSPQPMGLPASGAVLDGPQWQLRGVEVEVALRLRRDLDRPAPGLDAAALAALLASAFDAVLPVVEIVETRLADWPEADPLARLADLQSHGTLVLGAPSTLGATAVDLRTIEASVQFDDRLVARARGGNPAGDLWPLIGWLAAHCAERGLPLRAGQLITTGACAGMQFARPGTGVLAELIGIGAVSVRF